MSANESAKHQVYEFGFSVRIALNIHSMSNVGTRGNTLLPRRVLLANGIETDAISGALLKHHHAESLAVRLATSGSHLCPACRNHDSQRAAAWVNSPEHSNSTASLTMTELLKCGLCDAHGFMIPRVKGREKERWAKDSLLNYSMAVALPESFAELQQFHTRQSQTNDEAMIFERPSRSAVYSLCMRFTTALIGVDSFTWEQLLTDEKERQLRHKLILLTLRDQLLGPQGALMASMLPHLTQLEGAITVQRIPGASAPIYSPLEHNYMQVLQSFESEEPKLEVHAFSDAQSFNTIMADLINDTIPCSFLRAEQN